MTEVSAPEEHELLLSEQEMQLGRLLMQGQSLASAAGVLEISEVEVRNSVKQICDKCGVGDLQEMRLLCRSD